MKLSKIISAMILSFVLVLSSFVQANAKRLTAAVADWTGGEISCQVAVTMLEEELGYKVKRIVFPSRWEYYSFDFVTQFFFKHCYSNLT